MHWDGNQEKFIQTAKPLLQQGVRKTSQFMKTKTEQVNQLTTMDHLKKSHSKVSNQKQYDRYNSIQCFSKVSEITESIDANDDPISGFITGGLVYLVCHLVRDHNKHILKALHYIFWQE
jgi:hypothetical protein